MEINRTVLFNILKKRTISILQSLQDSNNNLIGEVKELFIGVRGVSDEDLQPINTFHDLWKLLVDKKIITKDEVQVLESVAGHVESEELKKEVEEYKIKISGMVQKASLSGDYCFSVILLKTVFQTAAVTGTAALIITVFHDDPEALKTLFSSILPYGMALVGLEKGSLYFVLETSMLSSLQQLWTSYQDGSLEKKFKKVINEIDKVRELTQGTEIDVTVEIDEDEYREACWVLVLAKIDQYEVEKKTKNVQKPCQRRHSLSCAKGLSHDEKQERKALKEKGRKLENETKQRICEKQPSEELWEQEKEVHKSTVNAKSEKEDITAIDDETQRLISAEDHKTINKLKKDIKSREETLKSALETGNKNELATAYFQTGLFCYVLGNLYEKTNEKENYEDTIKKAESYFREAADFWEKLNALLNNEEEKSKIDDALFKTYQCLTTVLLATKQTEEALIISDFTRDRDLVDTMIEKFQMNQEIFNESMRYSNISSILENGSVSVLIYAVKDNKINMWTLEYQKPSIFLETSFPAVTLSDYEALTSLHLMYDVWIAPVLPNLTQDKLVIIADGLLKSAPCKHRSTSCR